MKRAAVVIAAMLFCLPLAVTAQAQDLKIGVANPAKIFSEMQETKDLKEKLDADNKTLTDQQKAKEDELQGIQSAIKILSPGTQQYNDKKREFFQKAAALEEWKKVNQAMMQDTQKFQMKGLFDKITDAVKGVAADEKLDLVIAETNVDFPDLDQINVDQLRGLINQRNVLFNSGKASIDDKVIAKLDADYKKAPTPTK